MNMGLDELSCEIVAYAGNAKSLFVQAAKLALAGDVKEAQTVFAEGKELFHKSHEAHKGILELFSKNVKLEIGVLLVHAECNLTSAEDFRIIAEMAIEHCERMGMPASNAEAIDVNE